MRSIALRLAAVLLSVVLAVHSDAIDASPRAEASAAALQAEVEKALVGFEGTAGVYIRKLDGSAEVAIRADEVFPTASMIKVPILLALLDRVEKKELSWTAPQTFEKSRLYSDHDMVGRLAEGKKIEIPELIFLMESMSDNSASLWCQDLAGGGEAINRWLEKKGIRETRVNSRTPGREAAKEKFGWGQTTPREMATLLTMIRERRAVSPGADAYADRALGRTYWVDEALSSIPTDVQVISKQGAVNASRSEVLLVAAPSGPFVVCVITKEQKDQSWDAKNHGFRLLRVITDLAWKHFEPKRANAPALDGARWP